MCGEGGGEGVSSVFFYLMKKRRRRNVNPFFFFFFCVRREDSDDIIALEMIKEKVAQGGMKMYVCVGIRINTLGTIRGVHIIFTL